MGRRSGTSRASLASSPPVPQPASSTGPAAIAPSRCRKAERRFAWLPWNHHISSSTAFSLSYSLRSKIGPFCASLRAGRAAPPRRGRKRRPHRLGDELAPVEHDGEKRPQAFDPIDLLAGQRFVAIILGEGDEEIRAAAVVGWDEVRREEIIGRDRWAADREGEFAVHEIEPILSFE